jgi:hypothetical protein
MLAATGILATDFRADFMNPAFPAVLGWYFMEPWTGISGFSAAGSFPHAVGERVILLFDTPHLLQDVRSARRLPTVIVGFRELILVVEVTAAVPALAA